jgi:hypothetical protein
MMVLPPTGLRVVVGPARIQVSCPLGLLSVFPVEAALPLAVPRAAFGDRGIADQFDPAGPRWGVSLAVDSCAGNPYTVLAGADKA